jgi:hypothetical protein
MVFWLPPAALALPHPQNHVRVPSPPFQLCVAGVRPLINLNDRPHSLAACSWLALSSSLATPQGFPGRPVSFCKDAQSLLWCNRSTRTQFLIFVCWMTHAKEEERRVTDGILPHTETRPPSVPNLDGALARITLPVDLQNDRPHILRAAPLSNPRLDRQTPSALRPPLLAACQEATRRSLEHGMHNPIQLMVCLPAYLV